MRVGVPDSPAGTFKARACAHRNGRQARLACRQGSAVRPLGARSIVLFDLVAAERYDPNALRSALGLLSDMQITEISAALAMLPKRWASFSDKPLFSVDGNEIQVDAEAVKELGLDFLGKTLSSAALQLGPYLLEYRNLLVRACDGTTPDIGRHS